MNFQDIENKISQYKKSTNNLLKTLQKDLDSLVYLETIYNKESRIAENAKHLPMLVEINKLLDIKTPNNYFIEDTKLETVKLKIAIPDERIIQEFCNLESTKTEQFLLRDEKDGKERVIEKHECNGAFFFFLKLRENNTEEIKEISPAEYLMLTTHININITRQITQKYTFILNKEKYNIYINKENNSAILEMTKGKPIPEFLYQI
jgi:hypothetical protein